MNKKQRLDRQKQYIKQISEFNIVSTIQKLSTKKIEILIKQSQINPYENKTLSDSEILNQMINIQCNEEIERITQHELTFLKQQNVKLSTYINYVTKYRNLLNNLLPEEYREFQRQYKIRRKKIINEIQQQNFNALELKNAMNNINDDRELISLNEQMKIIREHNPIVRNAQIALYKMSAGKSAHQQLKAQYTAKKVQRQRNLEQINYALYLQIAINLLSGDGDLAGQPLTQNIYIHNILMGICALTGRRQIEIIKTGCFEYNGDYSLAFTGQVKTQNISKETYEIPTLYNSRKILEAHKRLKIAVEKHPSLSNPNLSKMQISNRLFSYKGTERLIYKTFSSIYPPEKIPEKISLRSIYGDICYQLFEPDASKTQYLVQILGHASSTSVDAYIRNKII